MKQCYIITAAASLVMSLTVSAAERTIPAGYYNRLDGKNAAALKSAASSAVYDHEIISYGDNTWAAFKSTDCRTIDGVDYWWDMYSNNLVRISSGHGGMNIEHSVANSWWDGVKNAAYKDLHHLNPSDATANNRKGNFPLGIVENVKWENGVTFVGTPAGESGGSSSVYEPCDEYKGDFARVFFYIFTCYENMKWGTRFTWMYNEGQTYPMFKPWAYNLLLEWSREDPVSQKEIDRNEAIYKIQRNRNPFIDFPGLEEYIWGTRSDEPFVLADHINGEPIDPDPDPDDPTPPVTKDGVLSTPADNATVDFGETVAGMESTYKLVFKGENLDETKAMELLISDMDGSTGAALFSFDGQPKLSVSTAMVNSEDGLTVTVNYRPKSTGEHTTHLIARRGGLKSPISLTLRGTSVAQPVLTAPVALPATDITENSYTANWLPAEGEDVDYFVINRTSYVDGTATTDRIEVDSDAVSYEITDFCGSESYTVQSVRLGVISPESNAVSVTPTSITGVNGAARFGLTPTADGVMLTCPGTIARIDIYEPSGRMVKTVSDAANGDVITLAPGLYIFRASGVASPLKVIVGTR